MVNAMIEKIKTRAREVLGRNDDAHGYHHAERVDNLASQIQQHEGGDGLILSVSSWMHDWCSSGGREYHVSEPALLEIENELLDLRFPSRIIKPVVEVIRRHEDYGYHEKSKLSKECLIFQDADRLDALGAIGIGRCFYTSASLGYPFGTPDDMHKLDEAYHIGQLTPAIQHFYTKLLDLKNDMNTEYATHFARERHDFMVEFLRRFGLEWKGKL
jgi:uncharacterized protein